MNYTTAVTNTKFGSYRPRHSDSLAYIGTHTFGTVNREEKQQYVDPFMYDAFTSYPFLDSMDKYEGFSRSYYTTEGHLASINNYSSASRFPPLTDLSWQSTCEHAENYFDSLPKVTSLNFMTELKSVPFEAQSAAGIGLQGKKGDPGNPSRAIAQANATVHNFMSNVQETIDNTSPDLAFTRTQLTQLGRLKVRNVFGQAFQYILIEGCTAAPLMEMFSKLDTFFFIGEDPRTGVPRIIREGLQQGHTLLSLDWSSFDAGVEDWEIDFAFRLLRRMLIFPNKESEAAFEFSRTFFTHRKLAGPNGLLFFKHRGVPSGSFFTILIDSIINWMRINYLSHRSCSVRPTYIKCQGDDSFTSYPEAAHVTPDKLATAIPAGSDWIFNPFKCPTGTSGDTVDFLQRTIRWGEFARDTNRVELLALYPEYPVTDPIISAYRARALWEDSNYSSHILAHATSALEAKYGYVDKSQIDSRYHIYWSRFIKL